MSHGLCKDCEEDVEVLIVRDQVVGPEEVICWECKTKRIMARAADQAAAIKETARELRMQRDQGQLPFDRKVTRMAKD